MLKNVVVPGVEAYSTPFVQALEVGVITAVTNILINYMFYNIMICF